MCHIITAKNNRGQDFKVADIKLDYVMNIINQASNCDAIDRIYLFGSSKEERCREDSDVDIAVFGKVTKSQMYKLAGYRKFKNGIYSYIKDGSFQDYDILYFRTGTNDTSEILDDVYKGELIYNRG